jgi:hypothetical protein
MDPLENERDVDQWLELELSRYGQVETRDGLDGRILANLQSERDRVASRSRWWRMVGVATAMAAVAIAVWIGIGPHRENPRSIAHSSPIQSSPTNSADSRESIQAKPPVAHRTGGIPVREVAKGRPAHLPTDELPAQRTPELEQFPSPRNLSEEEALLIRHLLVWRLNGQSDKEALLEATTTRPEADLSIDSLEIRPLHVPDIEISESKTN